VGDPGFDERQLQRADGSHILGVVLVGQGQLAAVCTVGAVGHLGCDVLVVALQTGPSPGVYLSQKVPSMPLVMMRLLARMRRPPYSRLVRFTLAQVLSP
jgi:hypothetical protein